MNKAQAAMEFLMTYGWVLVVALLAISAFAYFGVLNPYAMLPDTCTSSYGVDCVDKAGISQNYITVALRNNIGFSINVTDVTGDQCQGFSGGATGTQDTLTTYATFNPIVVPLHQVFRLQIDCDEPLPVGDRHKDTLTLTYVNMETGLLHQSPIHLRGKVG